jgi:hypothetical protein
VLKYVKTGELETHCFDLQSLCFDMDAHCWCRAGVCWGAAELRSAGKLVPPIHNIPYQIIYQLSIDISRY